MNEHYEDLMYQAGAEIANAIVEYYPIDLQDEITSIIWEHTSDDMIGISYATSDIINCIESYTAEECPESLIEEIENIFYEIYGA